MLKHLFFIHFVRLQISQPSAGALPIVVKFCMAVRPDLRYFFSYFGGIAPGMAEFWASSGAISREVRKSVRASPNMGVVRNSECN